MVNLQYYTRRLVTIIIYLGLTGRCESKIEFCVGFNSEKICTNLKILGG